MQPRAYSIVSAILAAGAVLLAASPARAKTKQTAPTAAVATGKKLDLRFIPSDAAAAVVVRPDRLLASPLFPAESRPFVAKDQIGFELRELDQAMLIFGFPSTANPTRPPIQMGSPYCGSQPTDMTCGSN
jgi:hypothetical protein